jgi:hypothetical protein
VTAISNSPARTASAAAGVRRGSRITLPMHVIEQLRSGSGAEFMHERHSNISVLFSHICDFDTHTSSMSPNEVIGLLNVIFSGQPRQGARAGWRR